MKNKLIECLSVGEENAVKSSELASMLNISRRDITAQINILRKKGNIICSSAKGYYLPSNNAEIISFIRQMKSRIADMKKATKSAENYIKNGDNQ